jgi:hypothetical protein
MANITHVWPDDDDPIFSGEFTVIFPIRLEKSTGKPSANDTDEESASGTSEAENPEQPSG